MMIKTESGHDSRLGHGWICRAAMACALLLGVGACTAVPEWADPSGWFGTDPAPQTKTQAGAATGSDSFPNLASVPDAKPKTLDPASQADIRQSLAADRAQAEYGGPSVAVAAGAGGDGTKMPAPAGEVQLPTTVPTVGGAAPGGQPVPMVTAQAPQVGAGPTAHGQSALRLPQFDTQAPAGSAAAGRHAELVAVIYFAYGSTALNDSDRQILRDVAALLRQRGGTLRVVGHASARTEIADAVRHRLANFETSLQRANAVAAQLMAFGVAKDKVAAEARGDAQPVYHEFMPTGEAGNRRTEIFLEN